MSDKKEFFKLFTLAVICWAGLIGGATLRDISHLFKDMFDGNVIYHLVSFIGLSVFILTSQYVFQHELKRKQKIIRKEWVDIIAGIEVDRLKDKYSHTECKKKLKESLKVFY